ncbi:MAG TPA: AI-2E family transporter, partial [Candidatus Dormibacteraeota bacterium]|nr:AI-2E family transporter [Candidatus Dormibacteraeota bacterium]
MPWAARGFGLAIGVALVVGLVALLIAAAPVVVVVFVAILLGSALEPVVERLRLLLGMARVATVLLVYAVFLAAVALLALLVVPAAIGQASETIGAVPPMLASARTWAGSLQPAALSAGVLGIVTAAQDLLQPRVAPKPDVIIQAGLTAAEALVSVVTVLALVFFWLVEHAMLQRYALAFVPASHRRGVRIAWDEAEQRLGQWVRGQLTLMATMGVATGIEYSVLGLPSALLLGLIGGVLEVIPMVGPLLGAVPAILVAATRSPELALLVTGIYVVIQFIEGNVLVPLVMRNAIGLSPFLVLVSILVGSAVAGIPGALLGVPVAATVEVVLERLQ